MKTVFDDDPGVESLDESTGYHPTDAELEAQSAEAAPKGRTPEGSESSKWNAVKHGLES
jgi:hypothetical protein